MTKKEAPDSSGYHLVTVREESAKNEFNTEEVRLLYPSYTVRNAVQLG